jgi:quinol monooxygenase YgiN
MLWRLKVDEARREEFEKLVGQLIKDVHTHEPSVMFEYRRVPADPNAFVLFLSSDDEAAYQRYTQAPWHTGVSGGIIACLAEPPAGEALDPF